MSEDKFGFVVYRDDWKLGPDYQKVPVDGPPSWCVFLPHQCDNWDIAGANYQGVPQETAVAELETFITAAQRALASLRDGEAHGDQDS